MKVTINPSLPKGTVKAPPAKSMAHRLLICAGLSEGESIVHGVAPSDDVTATLACLNALGAECRLEGETAYIKGIDFESELTEFKLPCNECGSTLRFFIPIALLTGKPATLTGSETLFTRPLSVYEDICRSQGILMRKGKNFVEVCGKLSPGDYTVRGDISSQFISGLLFTLPLLKGDSLIRITEPFESASYVKMTVDALKMFSVNAVYLDDNTIKICGSQKYKPCEVSVEGDYSNAAFLDALNLVGGDVFVTGLKENSLQGDRVYKEKFEKLKCGKPTVDISDCPDLGPVLFACAAFLNGAKFTGTKRLRIKESDRAQAMAQELSKFSVKVNLSENTAEIEKTEIKKPTCVLDGHNDHRIVMALSVLLCKTGGEIEGAQAVNKSYPNFFDDLRSLGTEVIFDAVDK